jgi:Glycosyltransferase family 87
VTDVGRLARFRPFVWPAVLVLLAATLYVTRVRREMVDFGVYRTAATRVLAAQPLYRPEDGHYQLKYLPAFAVLMTPFALLDADAARGTWFAMSVGLLTAFVRWSIRGLPERRRSERVLVWITVVLMAKFYAHELLLGQTNILLGVLLVAALLAAQIDRPGFAAVLIGLAAFVKPYALVLLPWLALSCGLAAAGICVAVVVAGLLLPAAIYGWSGNLALLAGWYHTVTASTAPNLLGADNISLAAMWAKWLGPGTAATALATATSGAALGLAGVVWVKRRRVAIPDYLEFALLMLLVPLLSPQGWDYVLLLATPAVVCLVDRWRDTAIAWRVLTGSALALMGLTTFDIMGRALYARFMALSIVSVAALAVAAALANLRWRALA